MRSEYPIPRAYILTDDGWLPDPYEMRTVEQVLAEANGEFVASPIVAIPPSAPPEMQAFFAGNGPASVERAKRLARNWLKLR